MVFSEMGNLDFFLCISFLYLFAPSVTLLFLSVYSLYVSIISMYFLSLSLSLYVFALYVHLRHLCVPFLYVSSDYLSSLYIFYLQIFGFYAYSLSHCFSFLCMMLLFMSPHSIWLFMQCLIFTYPLSLKDRLLLLYLLSLYLLSLCNPKPSFSLSDHTHSLFLSPFIFPSLFIHSIYFTLSL